MAKRRWLTSDEEAAWRALAQVMVKLPWALECQLQRDAGLSFLEYHVLAFLSEAPEHTRRMSELAQVANSSLSRLSHLFNRLEARGFVRREPDPSDGRYTLAILTDAGYDHLVATAPKHVAAVRDLCIEPLGTGGVEAMNGLCRRILDRLSGAN